jgi:hypothetical protein
VPAIAEGRKALEFTLTGAAGERVSLKDLHQGSLRLPRSLGRAAARGRGRQIPFTLILRSNTMK